MRSLNLENLDLKLHWKYFFALEDLFEKSTFYVEPDKENYTTYSIQFTHIILAACSEIDVVCKVLCERLCKDSGISLPNKPNILDYKKTILEKESKFNTFIVYMHGYDLDFTPWEAWSNKEDKTNPAWWKAYNDLKHHRHDNYAKGNLENCINSLAALYLLFCFCKMDTTEDQSRFFNWSASGYLRNRRRNIK